MTALTVRLPNSVHQKVRELAERDEISVNQFIAAAVSEKMASVMTLDYLKSEAGKGSRCDGIHLQFRCALKVFHIVCDDVLATGCHSAFQNHVVVRIAQKRSPQEMHVLQVRN